MGYDDMNGTTPKGCPGERARLTEIALPIFGYCLLQP